MRAVVQRVREASVTIGGDEVARIGVGLAILVGIEVGDTQDDVAWLAEKIARMRIFSDDEGRMNRDIREIGGEALVVSQFTLHASTKKGNRPGFTAAARPDEAIPLYERFLAMLEPLVGRAVQRGVFGADMLVSLVNDGPVTIVIDSRRRE
ncbi:MAG: D-tyrosyl-tRNA(Tyr) deacylase [Planctomycetia bacterium]|nr:D-tyrosyl-tRNA(Tyr) deacylase [Planctomycetia bacterium]